MCCLPPGPAPVQTSRKSAVDRRPVDQGGMGGLVLGDLQSMAREEGEGMETSETESLSSTYLPSLEQLLTSPDPKQGTCVYMHISKGYGGVGLIPTMDTFVLHTVNCVFEYNCLLKDHFLCVIGCRAVCVAGGAD